jgi:hypothetical protein
MTFNLIDMHVLPGTAWMVDFGRLADAVFPVLAIVLVGLAPPHPRFCAEHPRGERYRFEANAGASGIPRASSPPPDKMPG